MTAIFSRIEAKGIYTDFAPPNLLTKTLGTAVGTIRQSLNQDTYSFRAQPLASDFTPPNLLLGTFVVPAAPFHPQLTSDNAQSVTARWSATDFIAPNLNVNNVLRPAPLRPTDTIGDRGTYRLGVYQDLIAPNLILTLPPPLVGPYVPVDIGAHIIRKGVYTDFHPVNTLLNSISLIGAGQSFPGRTLESFIPKRSPSVDIATPNFLTNQLVIKNPTIPQAIDGLPQRARWSATDFVPGNYLTGPNAIFLGNPPKINHDPSRYILRRPGVYDDTPPQNFLSGLQSLAVNTPLSNEDDCAQSFRKPYLASDFTPPNLIAGIIASGGSPQPPGTGGAPLGGGASLALLPYTFQDQPTGWRRISETVNKLIQTRQAGTFNTIFGSGQVQYSGPSGALAGSNNLIFGTQLPNPSGTPGAALLMGSGGGNGQNVAFWVITDQAFDVSTPGNDLGFTAGETQPGSAARGGNLTLVAGASDLGTGGTLQLQGGTSANGTPGLTILQGANNTAGTAPAGDVFVIAGEEGSAGANVHLIATVLNNIAGVIRHRFNSTITWDESAGGQWFLYDLPGSPRGGFGDVGAPLISGGQNGATQWGNSSTGVTASGAISYNKAAGGTGTITVVNGLITAMT